MTEPDNLAELKTEVLQLGTEAPAPPTTPIDEPTMQISAAELLADDD